MSSIPDDIEIPLCIRKLDERNTRVTCVGYSVPFDSLFSPPRQNLVTGEWKALAVIHGSLCVVECRVTRIKEALQS